jgi:phosphatidylinositol glycan class M
MFARLFAAAVALRAAFFAFGLYQDRYLAVKYTDIDYLVFSDAARYVLAGQLPYLRDTYRYTPLLAWMLVPNRYCYSFGKMVFMACDLVTGALIVALLRRQRPAVPPRRQWALASMWLLNPVVVAISTRGSSESVLTVMVMALLYLLAVRREAALAVALGLAIHFKIYPVIYLPSIVLHLLRGARVPLNAAAARYAAIAAATTAALNAAMYYLYGYDFLNHTYLYHLGRVDHRHNFLVYNVAMYFASAYPSAVAKVAFVPQLALCGLIAVVFARRNLVACLFLQTFAFVAFNKVMTLQYFVWFLILLPQYLALLKWFERRWWRTAAVAVAAWAAAQAAWLWLAYRLEFLGESTFCWLFAAAAVFFGVNCVTLGLLMEAV